MNFILICYFIFATIISSIITLITPRKNTTKNNSTLYYFVICYVLNSIVYGLIFQLQGFKVLGLHLLTLIFSQL